MKQIFTLTLPLICIFFMSFSSHLSVKDTTKLRAYTHHSVDSIRYYYFPNLQAYFDLKTKEYIYVVNKQWVRKSYIPRGYRGYSIYNKFYIILKDINPKDSMPFKKIEYHKKKYPADFKGKYLKSKKKNT